MKNKSKFLVLVLVLLAFTLGIFYHKEFLNTNNEDLKGDNRKVSKKESEKMQASKEIKKREDSKELKNTNDKENDLGIQKKVRSRKNDSDIIIIDSEDYPIMPETDSHKINSKKEKKIYDNKYEEDSNNISKTKDEDKSVEKDLKNQSRKELDQDIKDHKNVIPEKPSKPISDEKTIENEENTNQKKPNEADLDKENQVDNRFSIFNLTTKEAGSIKINKEINLPESILIGLKNTGENDGKNHRIKWYGDDYEKIIKKEPGIYTLIAESLEDIVINDINYEKVKFEIKIVVE